MSSTSDIQAKWQERKNSGLDLGTAVGAEQDAGWGGRVQTCQNGRIYWHRDVGTHEVHGEILTKFLQNPRTYYASRNASVGLGDQRVMVTVTEGAPPNGAPSNAVQDSRYEGEEWRLQVPPYATT